VIPAQEFDVVVSVGTDHHRFDRLIGWMDNWLRKQTEPPSCLVQYGSSAAPLAADGVDLMSKDEMVALYSSAKVVVVQGGPGSIFDARGVGHLPIAIPRKAVLKEVVDDHQVAFCRQMEQEGEVILVEREDDLHAALDSAMKHPESVRKDPRDPLATAAATALRETMDQVLARRAGGISLRRALEILKRVRT
jgi:UDP-N-acetylglucosamine transferase subunit ALG13